MRKLRVAAFVSAVTLAISLPGGIADAAQPEYAPVDRPGPALTVDQQWMDSALSCTADVASSPTTPVLLMHGGGGSSKTHNAWNYQKAFIAQQIPFCTLDLTYDGTLHRQTDYQIVAEYIVNAIRTMHEMRGGKISMLTQSFTGPISRWALRFWPDTRAMVDDLVQLMPPNHGTSPSADILCVASSVINLAPGGKCPPAFVQLKNSSHWMQALNSIQETFPGISYTPIVSKFDELIGIPPNGAAESGFLNPAGADPGQVTNVALQDICPLDVSDHIFGLGVSSAGYALVMDALTHPGPAVPSRIDRSICLNPIMPYVDPLTLPVELAAGMVELSTTFAKGLIYSAQPSEPALRCYTLASGCPGS